MIRGFPGFEPLSQLFNLSGQSSVPQNLFVIIVMVNIFVEVFTKVSYNEMITTRWKSYGVNYQLFFTNIWYWRDHRLQ